MLSVPPSSGSHTARNAAVVAAYRTDVDDDVTVGVPAEDIFALDQVISLPRFGAVDG